MSMCFDSMQMHEEESLKDREEEFDDNPLFEQSIGINRREIQ